MYNRSRYGSVGYNAVARYIILPVVGNVEEELQGGVFEAVKKRVPGVRFRKHSFNIDGKKRFKSSITLEVRAKCRVWKKHKYDVVAFQRVLNSSSMDVTAKARHFGWDERAVKINVGRYFSKVIRVTGIADKKVTQQVPVVASAKYGDYVKTYETSAKVRHSFVDKKIVTGFRDLTPILVACGLIDCESEDE
jgi:hypothetical protein